MNTVTHEILLHSDQRFGSRLPPQYIGHVLAEVPRAIQQSISMALRNRSTARGRRPPWLDRAADIRFVAHDGDGETTLVFEAPTLGDAAPELYQQQELWPTRPAAEDTGFDLFGDVLADVQQHDADSEHFDPPLLKQLASGRLLRVDAEAISNGEHEPSLWSRMPQPGTAKLDLSSLRKAQGPRSGMAAILGRWPGEETDDEVEAALARLPEIS